MKNCIHCLVLCTYLLLLFTSCNKRKEFLDKPPTSDLFTPKTVSDLQTLLDNDVYMNEVPELGTLSGDEYYLMDELYDRLPDKERNSYTWEKDIYKGQGDIPDWNLPYKQVLYANIVLERIEEGVEGPASQYDLDNLKGHALFIRGFALNNIAVQFAKMYDGTNSSELGVPIRLSSDITQGSRRANLKETYDQIIDDLTEASRLLQEPLSQQYRNRPGKAAAFAAMARVYLSIRSYTKAQEAADSSLKYYNKLIDYNSIDLGSFLLFKPTNAETLYQANLYSSSQVVIGVSSPGCIIDSVLYRSYDENDLRKIVYFRLNAGLPNIQGGYTGTIFTFGGLAVDEVVLVRAECLARDNKVQEAMNVLNSLLRNRWKTGTYVNRIALTRDAALKIILEERKKELVFRGTRWADLKRLNKEGANIQLKRIIKGITYTLGPSDPKYVLPIPPDVILLGGIPQNPR